jgi:hypothetical protein
MQQSRIFVGMVLILIFGEVLGLYGYVLHGSVYFMVNTLAENEQIDRLSNSEHESIWLSGLIYAECKWFSIARSLDCFESV